jgi:hypothetical protein
MEDIDANLERVLATESDPEKRRDALLKVLVAHMRMASEQLAERTVAAHLVDKRMTAIESELQANTQITSEVRDLLAAFRAGFRVLGWLGNMVRWAGYLAGAAGAIYGFYLLVRHGGPKP